MYGAYYNGVSYDDRSKHLQDVLNAEARKTDAEKAEREAAAERIHKLLDTVQAAWKKRDAARNEEDGKKADKKTLLSKVCKTANRIPRSVSRKEAFSTAWKIVKNGGYEIKVAGVSFYNRQEALRRLSHYDPKDVHAFLMPEYDNPYDANAISVQVMVNGGKGVYRLGYVPKTETAVAKAFLGTEAALQVIDGDIKGARLRLAA
jgi:hypothetical protein